MYQYKGTEDTIAAVATPSGVGGIGIVRLSGPDALSIADAIFKAKLGKKPSTLPAGRVIYGWVVCDGEVVDEALLTVMRAPKSYTKQDVVEISSHGGPVSLKSILTLICQRGARLAEPGEFTRRAFLSGRIDLAQAEAVLDIIQSKTESFLRVSTNQLNGELSSELNVIRKQLLAAYVEIEAIVNFPEDDIDVKTFEQLKKNILDAKGAVEKLLLSSKEGRLLKDGIKIVICGKPNAGKSSLLNILLKTERAIVSDVAGTTRDTIEESAQINGVPFHLIDTAGILEPRDLIEEEAVKRSRMAINQADLILFMLDASRPLNAEDGQMVKLVSGLNVLAVINKCDLSPQIDMDWAAKEFGVNKVAQISVLKKEGIESLQEKILETAGHANAASSGAVMVSNLRHIQALQNAKDHLKKADVLLAQKESLEFVSEEIKLAVNELDAITGRLIDTDLLDTIFSQFCIGK